ncbi:MAG: hypothetical protein QOF08_1471 [Gaiellales bacterium]|nr:hypothetical protein [Gaiellales bacterium]
MRRPLQALLLLTAASLVWVAPASASLNRWRLVNELSLGGVASIVVSPSDHSVIWAAERTFYIYRSGDGGATWSAQGQRSPDCLGFNGLAVDPLDADTAYAACFLGGMRKTSDGGLTWTTINNGLADPSLGGWTPEITDVAINSSGTLFATAALPGAVAGSVNRSTDGGATWMPVLNDGWTESVVADPQDPQTVYAGGMSGVSHSSDGGDTWSAPSGPSRAVIAVDPSTPATVYAATTLGDSLSRSDDSGQTWTTIPTGLVHIHALAVTSAAVYAASSSGMAKSGDGGETWQVSQPDLGGPMTFDTVSVDPADPDRVLGGADMGGIWQLEFTPAVPSGLTPYWAGGTTAVNDITPTSATLTGVLGEVPAGATAFYHFEWGATASYGQQQDVQLVSPEGISPEQPVSDTITGLTPGTTYHVHLVAAAGLGFGWAQERPDDVTFTTSPPIPAWIDTPTDVAFLPGQVSDGLLPLRLRWTAHHGTYPVCSTQLQRYANGAWARVPLPSANARSAGLALAAGWSERRFRVRAQDCHGLAGSWTSARPFMVHAAQDGSGLIRYSAGWTPRPSSGAYGGGLHVATSRGATARFSFTGRAVSVIAPTGARYGRAQIRLDGVAVATVDLHRTRLSSRIVVFAHDWPTGGSHTITVRVLGTPGHPAIALDAIAVVR